MVNWTYITIIFGLYGVLSLYWLIFHKFKSSSNNKKVLQLDLDWNTKLALHAEILGFSFLIASAAILSGEDILIELASNKISLFDSVFTLGILVLIYASVLAGKTNALYKELRELLK